MKLTRTVDTLPYDAWIRTCQECGHIQEDKKPDFNKELTTAYRNRKCKECKSEALDYGHDNGYVPDWEND